MDYANVANSMWFRIIRINVVIGVPQTLQAEHDLRNANGVSRSTSPSRTLRNYLLLPLLLLLSLFYLPMPMENIQCENTRLHSFVSTFFDWPPSPARTAVINRLLHSPVICLGEWFSIALTTTNAGILFHIEHREEDRNINRSTSFVVQIQRFLLCIQRVQDVRNRTVILFSVFASNSELHQNESCLRIALGENGHNCQSQKQKLKNFFFNDLQSVRKVQNSHKVIWTLLQRKKEKCQHRSRGCSSCWRQNLEDSSANWNWTRAKKKRKEEKRSEKAIQTSRDENRKERIGISREPPRTCWQKACPRVQIYKTYLKQVSSTRLPDNDCGAYAHTQSHTHGHMDNNRNDDDAAPVDKYEKH